MVVVVDPADYDEVAAAAAGGDLALAQRQGLAAKAFRHTADYDVAVASWMTSVVAPEPESVFPGWAAGTWDRTAVPLRRESRTRPRPVREP